MSIITKLYDRMTGVLGRDRKGRRIRAGDLVMLVGDEVRPEWRVSVVTVMRRWTPTNPLVIETWGSHGWVEVKSFPRYCQCSDLIRIDDNGEASWRHVAGATGWQPRTVPQRDEVEA